MDSPAGPARPPVVIDRAGTETESGRTMRSSPEVPCTVTDVEHSEYSASPLLTAARSAEAAHVVDNTLATTTRMRGTKNSPLSQSSVLSQGQQKGRWRPPPSQITTYRAAIAALTHDVDVGGYCLRTSPSVATQRNLHGEAVLTRRLPGAVRTWLRCQLLMGREPDESRKRASPSVH
jgi:hypothetical protein